MEIGIKTKRLSEGRYNISIKEKTYHVYNPSKDDKEYPYIWFIQGDDQEGFKTLKEVKEYIKSKS